MLRTDFFFIFLLQMTLQAKLEKTDGVGLSFLFPMVNRVNVILNRQISVARNGASAEVTRSIVIVQRASITSSWANDGMPLALYLGNSIIQYNIISITPLPNRRNLQKEYLLICSYSYVHLLTQVGTYFSVLGKANTKSLIGTQKNT